jgi:hypothetical protein
VKETGAKRTNRRARGTALRRLLEDHAEDLFELSLFSLEDPDVNETGLALSRAGNVENCSSEAPFSFLPQVVCPAPWSKSSSLEQVPNSPASVSIFFASHMLFLFFFSLSFFAFSLF